MTVSVMRDLIHATYLATSDAAFDVEKRARGVALGQTTDTWTPVGSAEMARLERHRGVVLDVQPLRQQQDRFAATFTVGYPPENTQGDTGTLLVMIFGKVSLDGRIKLLDLKLPDSFLAKLPGPRFGIPGLRARLGIPERPVMMSIFKPCVGLTPAELGAMYGQQALGGSDVIKDDEILPDLEECPTEERLTACLETGRLATQETGRPSLYAVNLTGPIDTLFERARSLVRQGANCLLFNVLAYGYPALEALARDPKVGVPVLAHPAIAGGLGSAPEHGIAYRVILGTLMRAAGADIVLFPSSYGSVALPASETDAIRDALTCPMGKVERVFPGPSAGIHPGLVPQILADYGKDVVINAGGGVHGHPQGARAGAMAFRQAIDLSLQGKALEETKSPELAQALGLWGNLYPPAETRPPFPASREREA